MRLICPKCGAQYEVPPEAIPSAGRDVQCSACGTTWFERPSAPEPSSEPEPWDLVPHADDEEEADDLAEAQAAPPVAPAPRPTVTPEVAGILRAEAEREAQARREEIARKTLAEPAPVQPAPIEPVAVQPVAPPPFRAEPLRETPRPARPAERALDIDQINSSLRSANDRIGGRAPQVRQARRGGGFARGFWGAILILAVLAGLYVIARPIVQAVPQTRVVLEPYAAAVDGARDWLDRQVSGFRGTNAPAD